MNERRPIFVAGLPSLLLIESGVSTLGANPLDIGPTPPPRSPPRGGPAWTGVFQDELRGLALMVAPVEGTSDAFEGILARGAEVYLAVGTVNALGQVFEGSFALPPFVSSKGERFGFTLRFTEPDSMVLVTGSTTYTLVRALGDPAQSMDLLRASFERLRGATRLRNETEAIKALRSISTAQTAFRERDLDRDGVLAYGTLEALARAGAIDAELGRGVKSGYRFECRPGAAAPEFLWMATATALELGVTGPRHFVTNHTCVIYYSRTTAFELGDPTAKIPAGATPVGK